MPSGEGTEGAFPVLDPKGFYSTSGACSVSPFTATVSGEGSARRQPEVALIGVLIEPPPARPRSPRSSPMRPIEDRAATITRGCAAIRYAIGSPTWRPRPTDREPPTNSEHVRATLRGIRRTVGAARPARPRPGRGSPAPWPFGVSRETLGETLPN
jgi:hypothetical protein